MVMGLGVVALVEVVSQGYNDTYYMAFIHIPSSP